MTENLAKMKCIPCEGGVAPMTPDETATHIKEVSGWQAIENHPSTALGASHLYREFKFKNFKEALAFVNKVGEIAESEDHHPNIEFGWGYVRIKLWTHAIGGLHLNDFILAAKVNELVISL